MMFMGFRGLGDYASCTDACDSSYGTGDNANPDLYSSCLNDCNVANAGTANSGSSGGTAPSPSASGQSSSTWSTALTSLVKGVTQGFVSPSGVCPPGSTGTYPACSCLPGSPGVYPTCLTPPTPFYESPLGIISIVGILGFLVWKLAK